MQLRDSHAHLNLEHDASRTGVAHGHLSVSRRTHETALSHEDHMESRAYESKPCRASA